MKEKIHIKVCGVTDSETALLAHRLGADRIGLNFYSGSPRSVTVEEARAIRKKAPGIGAVYVQVRPGDEELRAAADECYDCYQLHFPAGEDLAVLESWSRLVTPERLCLAPRLAPGDAFCEEWFDFAAGFLIDAFRRDRYGGTGQTADWERFSELSLRRPEKQWVLAGGLRPENIEDALSKTGALHVDVNSGIESAPGKKDPVRMKEFFRRARPGGISICG